MRRIVLMFAMTAAYAGLAAAPLDDAPSTRWRQAWGLSQMPTPATRPGTDSASAAMVKLRIEARPPHYLARAENLLAGPVQVQLRLRHDMPLQALQALPALPLRALLAAGSRSTLSELGSDHSPAGQLDLLLDAVPGDPAARPQDHLYQLPFETDRIRVDQGFDGRFSHQDAQNRYAVDFALPDGSKVLAARRGTVMQVRDADDREANFIRLLHDDGSMAIYAHLQPAGVRVRTGQRVAAGQLIGLSGNSGRSTAPHLHFAVQVNAGMRLESIPFRMLSPRGELHFPRIMPSADAAPAP